MSSFRRGASVAIACGALFFFTACNEKKQDAAAPPPSGGIPPLDQPTTAGTAPTDHPTHAPAQAAAPEGLPPGHPPLPADHPSMAGGPAPTGATPGIFGGTTPGGQFDPKTVLAGVIKLDGKLKDKVAPGDVVFVVARRYEEGATGPGTPLAVQKLNVDKFPLKFSLDSRDAMLAGTTLSGKVIVTVRVDKDGDAMTKNPGDVTGQSKPVEPPHKDLVVALDKVL
ncbi:MAG TPA: hypothetical protein VHB97_02780 [Polyangia bacterium]|jgi:hypothetical protein|nr:hypothetical protein [Polyangia bacterium]